MSFSDNDNSRSDNSRSDNSRSDNSYRISKFYGQASGMVKKKESRKEGE